MRVMHCEVSALRVGMWYKLSGSLWSMGHEAPLVWGWEGHSYIQFTVYCICLTLPPRCTCPPLIYVMPHLSSPWQPSGFNIIICSEQNLFFNFNQLFPYRTLIDFNSIKFDWVHHVKQESLLSVTQKRQDEESKSLYGQFVPCFLAILCSRGVMSSKSSSRHPHSLSTGSA